MNGTTEISKEEAEPKVYQGYCFMKMKNNFYNLQPFNMIKPWKLLDHKGASINFNFCSNIDTSCHPNDVLIADPKACKKFAGKSDEEKVWTISKDKNKNDVLTIKFPQGDSCGNGHFYQTTVELTCDRKVNVPEITNNKSFDQTKCQNTIQMKSKHACSKGKFSAWWNQFGMPKQALAGCLIVIGLYFIIFGVYFWKTNSTLINCGILGLILYSFLTLFVKINLGLCMLLGIAIACVAVAFESFNAVILGVVVGYLFGSLLYNLLVKAIPVNPQALYWSTLIICILFISIAGGFMKAYMVCLATSLVGSYALVRGVSVYAGGYPDETYVMQLINNGEYTQFGRVFGPKIYAYIGGIFLLTGIGFWIQSTMVPKNPEEEVKKTEEVKVEEKKEEKKEEIIPTKPEEKPLSEETTTKLNTALTEALADKKEELKHEDKKEEHI
jgi:hypothetical protein